MTQSSSKLNHFESWGQKIYAETFMEIGEIEQTSGRFVAELTYFLNKIPNIEKK